MLIYPPLTVASFAVSLLRLNVSILLSIWWPNWQKLHFICLCISLILNMFPCVCHLFFFCDLLVFAHSSSRMVSLFVTVLSILTFSLMHILLISPVCHLPSYTLIVHWAFRRYSLPSHIRPSFPSWFLPVVCICLNGLHSFPRLPKYLSNISFWYFYPFVYI